VDIVIVDDHPILRFAVRELVGGHRLDLSIVGEAESSQDAVALIEARRPDLVLMDMLLPGRSGISAIRDIGRACPACRVLVDTALTDPVYAIEAFAAGAAGYALKNQPVEDLAGAIDQVARRETLGRAGPATDPRSRRVCWRRARGRAACRTSRRARRRCSTSSSTGTRTRRVASTLFISERTVETHRCRINRKLGIHSTAELIRFAARQQMIQA
jgi:DNA-binding NarL/FixJ family response regulator